MNARDTLKKLYTFTVPDTLGNDWEMTYQVEFSVVGDNQVAAKYDTKWGESGQFLIEDCGITWTSLFVTWHYLVARAGETSRLWNRLELAEPAPSDNGKPSNTRSKVIHRPASEH